MFVWLLVYLTRILPVLVLNLYNLYLECTIKINTSFLDVLVHTMLRDICCCLCWSTQCADRMTGAKKVCFFTIHCKHLIWLWQDRSQLQFLDRPLMLNTWCSCANQDHLCLAFSLRYWRCTGDFITSIMKHRVCRQIHGRLEVATHGPIFAACLLHPSGYHKV